jgi:hypothetical protein
MQMKTRLWSAVAVVVSLVASALAGASLAMALDIRNPDPPASPVWEARELPRGWSWTREPITFDGMFMREGRSR